VIRVHPSLSSLETSSIGLTSTSVVGTINGSTTDSKLPNYIVTFSFLREAKSQCLPQSIVWLVSAASSKSKMIVTSLTNCIIHSFERNALFKRVIDDHVIPTMLRVISLSCFYMEFWW